jgi:hypothetical protein
MAFSAFILNKFGKEITSNYSSPDGFSLLVAFGRCRFCLDDSFAASSLSTILGCPTEALNVSLLKDRIFFFSVSCKEVGFEIYSLPSFACDEFVLFFHLFNEAGLVAAHSSAFGRSKPFSLD